MGRFFVCALCFVSLLIGGCSIYMKDVAQVERKTVVPFAAGEAVRPLQFTKIVVKLPRGRRIGTMQVGVFCIDSGPLTWRGGKLTLSGDEFTEAFREELEKANCPVVGDTDALFEDPSTWKAEFLLAGLVKEMKANVCYPLAGLGDYNNAKGSAYMKVDWQIYSRLERRVVYEASTEGVGTVQTETPGGDTMAFVDAFALATQNLLADEGFRKLIVRPTAKDVAVPPEEIRLSQVKQYETSLAEHVSQNRMGVVTIFAGGGHGTGFFISEHGYLLTNEHVVRAARLVTVKLITGRELIGEVIRKNSVRDVAIIKVEEPGMVPLPIRSTSPNVGDEVYVLGAPLNEELSATLTKGIVSAFRVEDGQRLIQSDVNVLPGCSGGPLLDVNGNVLGLASAAILISEAPTGLNFFVPVGEALQCLNITFPE
jgi:serine protease Do